MGWNEQLDAMILSKSAAKVRFVGILVLLVVFTLDGITVILLREAPLLVASTMEMASGDAADSAPDWSWDGLLDGLGDFSGDTVDCCLLFLIRLVVLCAIGTIAVRVGQPQLDNLMPALPALPARSNGVCSACHPHGINATFSSTSTAPLLINQPASSAATVGDTTAANGNAPSATPKPTTEVKEEHLLSHQRKLAAEQRKNVAIGALFLSATAMQVFVGIKCIGFVGEWAESPELETLQGALMGASVLFVNIEAWLVKRLVNALTAEEGFIVPEFHKHRLYFRVDLPMHRCDMCRNQSRGGMYHCQMCDFDVCPACFNKKDKATGEGILRGDKGVKQGEHLTFTQYLGRAMRLVLPHIPLFVVAIACLASKSIINLFLPNLQGRILDHVVAARAACAANASAALSDETPDTAPVCDEARQSFRETVAHYLSLSIVLGILGGLQSLSFMVVGRKIMVWIRGQLFRRIVVQDIAFFDGFRTGDLVQRLTGDVRAMIQPLQNTLATLLSNLILLFGGVVMCFVTSWRLSMLAFTTVLPIMHVTESYAWWSGKINKQIYQHYADGASIVTEAFQNVRTVRAVSSEPFEIERFEVTLRLALSKGVKDAIFGAFSNAFNNYLDLGAGVLILWYGGSIAMEPEGSITVGNLITYQLYWNMLNNSLQALNNVLNEFTRAAGAAERVLSLVDLTPDIDPTTGLPVEQAVHAWSIEFRQVHFRYQMRPLQTVLDGMSFRIHEGTVCALVGRSGGGKSTMIHLMLRFYDPTEGSIAIGGVDLRDLHLPSVHRRIGVVSQETQLFNATIRENIAYGAPDGYTEEELVAATRAAQALDFIHSFEDGFATRVGERGQRLSGGQKQRIAIARCLLRRPRLLLLDEATSALDTESEAAVQKALDEMIWERGGYTVLLVAHRLSTVVNSQTIVVVDKGKAAEIGSHEALLAQNGAYASLVAHQLLKQREQLDQDTQAGTSGSASGAAPPGGTPLVRVRRGDS